MPDTTRLTSQQTNKQSHFQLTIGAQNSSAEVLITIPAVVRAIQKGSLCTPAIDIAEQWRVGPYAEGIGPSRSVCRCKSKHTAHDEGIVVREVRITNGPPSAVDPDLHSPLTVAAAVCQTHEDSPPITCVVGTEKRTHNRVQCRNEFQPNGLCPLLQTCAMLKLQMILIIRKFHDRQP